MEFEDTIYSNDTFISSVFYQRWKVMGLLNSLLDLFIVNFSVNLSIRMKLIFLKSNLAK